MVGKVEWVVLPYLVDKEQELLYMTIDLPGARGLFSHMQESLHHVESKHVVLTRDVHQALADF